MKPKDNGYLRNLYEHLHAMVFVPLKLDLPPEWQVTLNILEIYGTNHDAIYNRINRSNCMVVNVQH